MREFPQARPSIELTRTRLLEVVREPEALFWMFVFPVIMAIALGIAFPSRTTDTVIVAVVDGPHAAATAQALRSAAGIEVRLLAPGEIETAVRRASMQIVVEPGPPPTYRYDPARAESRLARRVVDDVLQRAGGRRDAWTPARRGRGVCGFPLHRLAGARAARHDDHADRPLGRRLLDRAVAHAQAAEAPRRHADAPQRLPAGADLRAHGVPGHRGRRAPRVRTPGVRRADARLVAADCRHDSDRRAQLRRASGCSPPAARRRWRGSRAC